MKAFSVTRLLILPTMSAVEVAWSAHSTNMQSEVNYIYLPCPISYLMHKKHQDISKTIAKYPKGLFAPLRLEAWEQSNCHGTLGITVFSDGVFSRNISNYQVSRSFSLNRTLEGQEQLDISVTKDFDSWYSDKDQLSMNSSSCTQFWQSYYAINGSNTCHNTQPFTCHRLWNNPGLSWT